MKETILVVDDAPDMLQLLQRSLEPELQCQVKTARSGAEALSLLEQEPADLALIDMKMPGMSGMELLEELRRRHPWLTVVMMTAHGCIELAVEAIKSGAYDFITKPFDHDALVLNLRKALERSRLLRENLNLQRRANLKDAFQNLVGRSAKMQRVYESIQMVAKTDLTVLVTGESGTGKDLVSRAIHALSDRRDRAFVAVNCPTVPEQILESELFGYRKGAFTHATQNKIGLFQEAHRGTIFLDEIGDISTTIQTKLLRVLQQKEIKPLGDTKSVHVDVRVIASTNRDLPGKIKAGEFREDLFYRLNVLPIVLPPLRERREDIPHLVSYLLEKHCAELNRPRKIVSAELMEYFLRAPWEGNVRELENVLIRGILFAPSEEIRAEDIGWQDRLQDKKCLVEDSVKLLDYREAKEELLQRFHERYIGDLLSRTQGNVTQAARTCGLERQALQQLMRKYGIRSEDFRSE
ncbi:sigma-54 dependent transcriptional regulator [Desulforhabdus sp. TSK]|uniref:sigma-54-dependent transcriptional regulator n=1 Tax=Desulforhabdus sp. TSK TaxID=2925014 RepID=UPI001FC85539|nr:sigma-54 dependent transcriptional regulator [Desulforhabdus sp. TSK]GKT09942.1 Fis family transcriptional regulator [Desulforhabdus sp. TSK]